MKYSRDELQSMAREFVGVMRANPFDQRITATLMVLSQITRLSPEQVEDNIRCMANGVFE